MEYSNILIIYIIGILEHWIASSINTFSTFCVQWMACISRWFYLLPCNPPHP